MGAEQQRLAVDSGVWPLYRFDPRRLDVGEPPLKLDATPGKTKVQQYMANEGRFRMVELADPARYKQLLKAAERDVAMRQAMYQHLQGCRCRYRAQTSCPKRQTSDTQRQADRAGSH